MTSSLLFYVFSAYLAAACLLGGVALKSWLNLKYYRYQAQDIEHKIKKTFL